MNTHHCTHQYSLYSLLIMQYTHVESFQTWHTAKLWNSIQFNLQKKWRSILFTHSKPNIAVVWLQKIHNPKCCTVLCCAVLCWSDLSFAVVWVRSQRHFTCWPEWHTLFLLLRAFHWKQCACWIKKDSILTIIGRMTSDQVTTQQYWHKATHTIGSIHSARSIQSSTYLAMN